MNEMGYLTLDDIETLTSVESLLRECGVSGKILDSGGYYTFRSPFHEDRHPSMILYKENLYCIDWSGEFRGSLSRFYKETTGKSLYRELGLTQKERDDSYYRRLGEKTRLEKSIQTYEDKIRNGTVSLSDYEMVVTGTGICYDFTQNRTAYSYARSRFIDEEFATYFHIGWTRNSTIKRVLRGLNTSSPGTPFVDRLVIPIYREGQIVSIEGRDYTRKQVKKCIYPRGGDVSSLFNIDNLKRNEPLVLVEGVMDMVRIWKHITRNVAPVFGVQITNRQREVICSFPDIIVFSDSDEAGERMISTVDSFYRDREFRVARLEKGDPGDPSNSVDDLKRAIDTALPCNEYFMKKTGLYDMNRINDDRLFSV